MGSQVAHAGTNDIGTGCINPSGTDTWSALRIWTRTSLSAPIAAASWKHGLAIARFIERPDIRVLLCEECHHVHWFAIEDGALRKL